MKFYLSLTDQDGVLIDRFRIELPRGENISDDCVMEDSEIASTRCAQDLAERLIRQMRQALKGATR